MRCATAHSITMGYRYGVATVSPNHNGFYDLLGFSQLGAERSYSTKLHDPVVALAIDYDDYRNPPEDLCAASYEVHAFLGPKNPYLPFMKAWDRRARVQFLNPEVLEHLFVEESDFLAACTPAELDIVRLRWGQELFNAVAVAIPGKLSVRPQFVKAVKVYQSAVRRTEQVTKPFASTWGALRMSAVGPREESIRGTAHFCFNSHRQLVESSPLIANWWSWVQTLLSADTERKPVFLGN
jgi:hypothetical protein